MVAAVAMFAAASCTQELENNAPETVGETVVFTASVDDAQTKAVLNETTRRSEWVADDKITLHNGTKSYDFTATAAGPCVDFSYTGNDFSGSKFMAVYPVGTYTADPAAKTVKAYIPTYQRARKNTYDEVAALAVAYTENNSLRFRNAHALIKFTINGTNIKAIEFYGNNEEAITGNMLVTLNADNSIKTVEGQDTVFEEGKAEEWTGKGTWVKIYSEDEANGWVFEDGATYYAAVAPANFTMGFSINYILDDDTKVEAVKKYEEPYDLSAGTILNLGTFEYEAPEVPEWAAPGAYNGWNTLSAMTKQGEFYVAKNVTKLDSKDNGFKIMHNGAWLGFTGGVSVNTWNTLGGDVNIFVTGASAAAEYDVYVYPSKKVFYVTPAGSAAPSVPNMYRFYVKNNVGWSNLNIFAWGDGGFASAAWPGDKMTLSANVGSYGVCKYVEVPKGTDVVNFIINNGSQQTKDLKVDGNSKVIPQSNGDYVYILDDEDIKKN